MLKNAVCVDAAQGLWEIPGFLSLWVVLSYVPQLPGPALVTGASHFSCELFCDVQKFMNERPVPPCTAKWLWKFWDLARKCKGSNLKLHKYPYACAREALQSCKNSLLWDPFGLWLLHLWGAWQRQDGVSYDFCKPACPTSTWQAHFLHTIICFCLFQVCFCLACLFYASVFSPQWSLVPPL